MSDYVVSRGKLYWSRPGEDGESYLGNSPGFKMAIASATLKIIDSEEGVLVQRDSVLVSSYSTLSLTLDAISNDNFGLYFGSTGDFIEEEPAAGSMTIRAKAGKLYKLPVTAVVTLGVKYGMVDIDLGSNFRFDPAFGILEVNRYPPDLYEGQELTIEYQSGRTTRKEVGSTITPQYGSIRYIEDNIVGTNRMFFFPSVIMMPDGTLDLKSMNWRELDFKVEVLAPVQVTSSRLTDDYGSFDAPTGTEDFGEIVGDAVADNYGEY